MTPGCRRAVRVPGILLLLGLAAAAGGCGGGRVVTNGVHLGAPNRYAPAQLEIDIDNSRSLNYVVADLYGPREFARKGAQFAPDARQAGFVLKPAGADGSPAYWEYYADGQARRLAHQPGLLLLRTADGQVSTAAVSPGRAGGELYRMLWGADPDLKHLKASDPNGLALPLIRVLAGAESVRNHPAFNDWFNAFQHWHQAESASAGR